MKTNIITCILSLLCFTVLSQQTYVPDNNFEQALINLGYDTVLDDYVTTANISGITSLNIYNKNIADLTGIEDFVSLTNLLCRSNQLTSLNVTQNIALTNLDCGNNQLTSLNISQNTALTHLTCNNNLLKSLDVSQNTAMTNLICNNNLLSGLNVDQNTVLMYLACGFNQLTSLNVDQNSALTYFTCHNNQLTSLDVSQNIELATLWCDNNQLTSLNVDLNTQLTDLSCTNNQLTNLEVSQNTALTNLSCTNNQLANLDVTQNTALTTLFCYYNQLSSLDVTQNTALTYLYCNNNQLSSLDVTQNSALEYFFCYNNQLSRLDVTQNTALIYLDCGSNQLTRLDVSQNTALTALASYSNQLTRLNVKNGNNTNFISFSASNNPNLYCIEVDNVSYSINNWTLYIDAQTSFNEDCMYQTFIPDDNFEQALIDLGYDTILDNYVATANIINIINLDISGKIIEDLTGIQDFESLTYLDCSANQLTSLDMSQNTILTNLSCNDNELIRLNVKNGNNTNFIAFNAFNNPNLFCIEVDNAVYSTINWTNIDPQSNYNQDCMYQTYVPDDNFEQALIDLGYDTVLDDYVTTTNISNIPSLNVYGKNIADLTGIQDFAKLTNLDCSFNQLTSLDVSQNKALTALDCFYNQLTRLYVNNGNNINFTDFRASYNFNLLCIEVDNATYSTTYWTDIDAQTTFSEDCMYPEYTYIPDDNFEYALIVLGYDTYLDDYVNKANISSITSLDIPGYYIADLTGIQDFVALTNLNCSYNQLINLDVSQNTSLTNLDSSNNALTSLDVSQNTSLTNLNCSFNQLSNLNISHNTALTDLICFSNQLTSLDLTQNTALTYLDCIYNQLTSLNLKNSNNTNITFFFAVFNPNLLCIDVDNESYSTTNWSYGIDIQTSFSEDCSTLSIDDNEIQDLVILYPNPTSNYINIKSKIAITKIEVFDLLGKSVLTKNNQGQINISNLNSGMYLIKIYYDKGQITKKIIIK